MIAVFHQRDRCCVVVLVALLATGATYAMAQDGGQPTAERLIIQFTAPSSFSLLSRSAVEKKIAPSDALPEVNGGLAGFWYELRNGNGAVLYRRIIGDPIRLEFEGPDIDMAGSSFPDRKESIPDTRTFAVLIPLAPPDGELVIFSSPLVAGAQGEPATDLAHISLAPVIP